MVPICKNSAGLFQFLAHNVANQRDFAAAERSGAVAKFPTELALLGDLTLPFAPNNFTWPIGTWELPPHVRDSVYYCTN